MRRVLAKPSLRRREEFLAAVARSRRLHAPWVSPPDSAEAFAAYLARLDSEGQMGYWVLAGGGELAGVVNISEIVMGAFCSGYLGYYAFVPWEGAGLMARGLHAVVREAFRAHGLHRLEANIQPDNTRSRALVQRLGFRYEGFSPKYLKIRGRWRDHERWALTREDWHVGRPHREDHDR